MSFLIEGVVIPLRVFRFAMLFVVLCFATCLAIVAAPPVAAYWLCAKGEQEMAEALLGILLLWAELFEFVYEYRVIKKDGV